MIQYKRVLRFEAVAWRERLVRAATTGADKAALEEADAFSMASGVAEPPPFDNDDDAAADETLGRLNQAVADAKTRGAQTAAIARAMRFLEHKRAKRMSRW